MKRPSIDEVGLWLAWLVFLIANACPAVALDLGSWSVGEIRYVPGYLCTGVTWPFWLSNALVLLLPLLMAFDRNRTWVRRLRWSLAGVFGISLIASLCLLPMFRAVAVGYWLWVASFLLAALAAVPWRRGLHAGRSETRG